MSSYICSRISVVIPALDEEGNIGRLVQETFAAVPAEALSDIIVVDDGSRDGTAAEVAALMTQYPKLRLLKHMVRSGQSAAVRTGVRFSKGDIVATMDGDGQNDPKDIPKLAALLEQRGPGTSLVGGIRVSRKAEGSKRLASRFANWLRDKVLDDGCPDTGCGIKVFRREIYLDLPFFCGMHRYMPALFQSYGHTVAYCPVNDRPRTRGLSKYTNLGRALIGIYDLVGVAWLIRRTRAPQVACIAQPADQVLWSSLSVTDGMTAASPIKPANHPIDVMEPAPWQRPSTLGGPHLPRVI
jgi:dolichol-phosphate mannosyltransferase